MLTSQQRFHCGPAALTPKLNFQFWVVAKLAKCLPECCLRRWGRTQQGLSVWLDGRTGGFGVHSGGSQVGQKGAGFCPFWLRTVCVCARAHTPACRCGVWFTEDIFILYPQMGTVGSAFWVALPLSFPSPGAGGQCCVMKFRVQKQGSGSEAGLGSVGWAGLRNAGKGSRHHPICPVECEG